MQKQLAQVETFQKSFNSVYNTEPTLLKEEDWKLRYKLSLEELDEYKEACEQGDIVEIFDAILDRLFLAFGDAVSHGLQDKLIDGFNEVVRSNISKLDNNGKPIINGENGVFDPTRPLGKVLKSYNYSPPNIKQFL